MKILVTDGLAQEAIAALEDFAEVDQAFYEETELGEALANYDAVIIRSATKIRQPVIDQAKKAGRLKLIIRAGVGIDNIDHAYAEEQGIAVRNTPMANSNAMAELAIAHLFATARFLAPANVTMKQDQWNKKDYRGVELRGKRIALVGYGNTARVVAQFADAMGMDVAYYDVLGKKEDSPHNFVDFPDILKEADFVSLHCPATKGACAMIGPEEMDMMKDGVRIINCSRGGLVDEAALLERLNSGKVAAAGLDVFENEPTPMAELVQHPNVSVTPHIGAQTYEAQARVGFEVVDVLKEFFKI